MVRIVAFVAGAGFWFVVGYFLEALIAYIRLGVAQ